MLGKGSGITAGKFTEGGNPICTCANPGKRRFSDPAENEKAGGVKLFKTGGCTSTAVGAGVIVIAIGTRGAGAPATAGGWKNDAMEGTPNTPDPNECGALTQRVHVIPSGAACMQTKPGEGGGCGTETWANTGVRHNKNEAAYFISAPNGRTRISGRSD